MAAAPILPRNAEQRLAEALADSPVVLVHGSRQCGKSTLVQRVGGPRGHVYFTLDDDVLRAAAQADPVGFVAGLPERAILDEVQRVPELFTALKLVVDRRRTPGRFLLTGSSNVLLLPKLADSLAGRMEILRLHPLGQDELDQRPSAFLDVLSKGRFATQRSERLGVELSRRIVSGGFPAALARSTAPRRAAWYRDYIETLVQRDVRDLSRIRSLDALPRLLEVAAGQTARLFNVSALASPFQLSVPTIRSYTTLLERVFLLELLPPWHSNRLNRLVKAPKLHITDTGIAASLLGVDAESLHADRGLLGQLLETFVLQELRRQASGRSDDVRFHHYRDKDQREVDVVLELPGRKLAGIEVKAGATVTAADFHGLGALASAAGERFVAGIVLHDGELAVSFGDRMQAVPVRWLWEA